MPVRKRLFISLAILLGVFWLGVLGYVLISPGMSIFDAVYMVSITLSTVGYREIGDLSPGQRLWTILIIMLGISIVAVVIGNLTGLIVEGEVGRIIGSRRLESRIKTLRNHVVVCGFGRMGQLLAQHLRERGESMVIIENDEQRCRQIEELNELYIRGDATEEKQLVHAGIERAKSLVAVLPSDADNVFVTLTAREMRPDLHIVARAEQISAQHKLVRAGADRVISPQAIGAERIANLLTRPHVVDFVEVAVKGVDLEIDQFLIGADSPIAGKSLRDTNLRRAANVMVVAIRNADGQTRFNPSADEIVRANDTLILIGEAGAANRLSAWQRGL